MSKIPFLQLIGFSHNDSDLDRLIPEMPGYTKVNRLLLTNCIRHIMDKSDPKITTLSLRWISVPSELLNNANCQLGSENIDARNVSLESKQIGGRGYN